MSAKQVLVDEREAGARARPRLDLHYTRSSGDPVENGGGPNGVDPSPTYGKNWRGVDPPLETRGRGRPG